MGTLGAKHYDPMTHVSALLVLSGHMFKLTKERSINMPPGKAMISSPQGSVPIDTHTTADAFSTASMSCPQIPSEIWLHIAKFIPQTTLRNLYSLNSLFLDLALDERYSEISFLQVNANTVPFLQHMRDRNLSSRVRRLRVNPIWFNLEATVPKPPLQSFYSVLARTLSISFNNRRKNEAAIRNNEQMKRRAYIDNLTTDLVVQFSNVTSFVLVTRYSPHPTSLPLFLNNSWRSFGANLRRLTINGPLAGFGTLLPPPLELVSLEDLTIRFSTDLGSDDPPADTRILTETIMPFLAHIAPRLRSLNFMSSALGDHSVLFHALDRMPTLTTLSLNLGFYPPLLTDASGLTSLLGKNSQNLKHVKLQPLETFRSPPVSGYAHDHFFNWMSANSSDEGLLSNLETLVVLPSTDVAAMFRLDASSLFISRSRDTLTSLVLGERCLSFTELNTLVSHFEHRTPDHGLKVLHVKLISLNPQVFDMLAAKLEGLDDLDIKFNVLLDDVQYENPRPIEDEEPTETVIDSFLNEMSNRLYPRWRLYSLWIWQRSYMTTKTAHEILIALKPSIPSVRVILRMDHSHPLQSLFN